MRWAATTGDVAFTTAGVATFTGCRIDRAGTYTLTATTTGLTAAVSDSFTVT